MCGRLVVGLVLNLDMFDGTKANFLFIYYKIGLMLKLRQWFVIKK